MGTLANIANFVTRLRNPTSPANSAVPPTPQGDTTLLRNYMSPRPTMQVRSALFDKGAASGTRILIGGLPRPSQ